MFRYVGSVPPRTPPPIVVKSDGEDIDDDDEEEEDEDEEEVEETDSGEGSDFENFKPKRPIIAAVRRDDGGKYTILLDKWLLSLSPSLQHSVS